VLLAAGWLLAVPKESTAQPRRQAGDVALSLGWSCLDTRVERAGNRTPRDNTLYGGVTATFGMRVIG
jgi:hypothetical protein